LSRRKETKKQKNKETTNHPRDTPRTKVSHDRGSPTNADFSDRNSSRRRRSKRRRDKREKKNDFCSLFYSQHDTRTRESHEQPASPKNPTNNQLEVQKRREKGKEERKEMKEKGKEERKETKEKGKEERKEMKGERTERKEERKKRKKE
jgi:nucleolar protein 56